ncbi:MULTISPECIES: helix-turn-helix transcriptional regulator [Paraburkholderia]|uniref:helix-turn-helix transcriptional regulator n=1 Tax=Paraburkholderia TaxID=1822464 RepID=UPI00224DFBD2|nr:MULTISPECIES: AlpA family phage regulatory protein [Paraburkholderia]MCX4156146.1 AlpA family phage regulatory protein [Paraburkholderia aspalathi]MDN7165552.1 AlpA family phage regulatory protein [Paraburkholderia sp. SECH2]MDQ6394038.1 AlpA family phage regulatory protein [Paraburkholderia aspalathi]
MSENLPGRGLRPKQAAEFIGISIRTLWRYTRTQSDFPKPLKLSPRATIFFENELATWLASRAKRARGVASMTKECGLLAVETYE